MAFGMMITACKKDEETTPSVTGGTVTIEYRTNRVIDISKDNREVYLNTNPDVKVLDSTISINNVADNSRIDIGMFAYKYPALLKIKYNNQIVLDTIVLDTTKNLYGISVSYFANKELWITP